MFAAILAGVFGATASVFTKLAVDENILEYQAFCFFLSPICRPIMIFWVIVFNALMWGFNLLAIRKSVLMAMLLSTGVNLSLTLIFSRLIFSEAITVLSVAGFCLILAGSLLLVKNQKDREDTIKAQEKAERELAKSKEGEVLNVVDGTPSQIMTDDDIDDDRV
ncbi:hypothetical protein PCE1_004710 [Barthelona sp. PCE]